MKRKGLSLLLILGVVFVFAGVSTANVPAPPVNQDIGVPDVEFSALTEEDCEACHTGNPDRHHMLYGSTIPDPSLVPNPDADSDGTPDTNYGCLNCHDEDNTGGVISFLVERDCLVCHTGDSPHHNATVPAITVGDCVSCHGDLVDNWDDGHDIPTYTPSLITPSPLASVCAVTGAPCGTDDYCTEDVCEEKGTLCSVDADCDPDVCEDSKDPCTDNYDCAPGHCSDDSVCNTNGDCGAGTDGRCRGEEECITGPDLCIIEGEQCVGSSTPQPGGCNYCHDAGTDTASGLEIVDNHDTHHGANIEWVLPGETRNCYTCHTHDGYDANDMRKCEECHGYESLHQIQADTPNPANPGTIVVGAEDSGYGHIGTQSGPDGDCWGCHGFSIAAAPPTGLVTPTLSDASATSITAGVATAITLTGNAFTNDAYTSVVEIAGIEVTPSAISVGSLTATLPALGAGNYKIRVKKDGVLSNPIGITCKPSVAIDSVDCADGVLTIAGSGFGDAAPAGAEEFINVKLGADTAEILSWSDTVITVSGCGDAVTVNALYGSASTGATACTGNFDGDADVDGTDASAFKADFGRSNIINPCAAGSLCNGDFDCDGDVDGSDASGIKGDFGRSAFNNGCAEEVAADCSY